MHGKQNAPRGPARLGRRSGRLKGKLSNGLSRPAAAAVGVVVRLLTLLVGRQLAAAAAGDGVAEDGSS